MPIFSSTITNIESNTMSSPYYVFDTDNAKIDFGDVSHLPVYKSNYSVEALVRFNAISGTGQMIWGDSDSNANNFVRLLLFTEGNTGLIRFDGHTSSPNQYNWIISTPQNVVAANKWHHIVGVLDRKVSANCGIWVDGLKVSNTVSNLDNGQNSHDFNNIRVGADYSNNYDFNGQISKVRCFNKALLDDEVIELYSGQSVRYSYKGSNSTNVAHDSTATSTRTEENDVDNWVGHNSPTISSISTPTDTGVSPAGGTYSLSCVQPNQNGSYFYLSTNGAMPVVKGKSYRTTMVYRLDNYATGRVGMSHSYNIWNGYWNGLGTHKFDGVDIGTNTAPADDNWHTYTFDWRVPDQGESYSSTSYFMMLETNNGNNGTVIIDALDVQRIGAVGEYDGSGIASDKWFDKSGNDLHGTVSNAIVENAPSSDDGLVYEEGSWTPTLEDPDGDEPTYFTNDGSYTRVGRLITFQGRFYINSTSGMSGTIEIKGLPYTSVNQTAVTFGELRQTNRGSGNLTFLATIVSNTTKISMVINNGDGKNNSNALQATAIGYASQWFFGGTYEI